MRVVLVLLLVSGVGLWAFRRSSLCHDPVRHVWSGGGDAVVSADGERVYLFAYASSGRPAVGVCRFPAGGGRIGVREGAAFYEWSRSTKELRPLGFSPTDRRAFRLAGKSEAVWWSHRQGPLYYAVASGRGPYGRRASTPDDRVPGLAQYYEVDVQDGGVRPLSDEEYRGATAGAESLRDAYGTSRFAWSFGRWTDRWGPARQVGGGHLRTLSRGGPIEEARLRLVVEDPTVWRKPEGSRDLVTLKDWPLHR